MQVTPEAGRDTSTRFGLPYDWTRMICDPVYNTQMGAAELSALMSEYKGSLIMTFAGYNAGRGRVRDWVKLRGDPRDPNVDAVDWVERIPFSETRNYVQRVIENLGVYRARFGTGTSAPAMAKQEQPAAPALAGKSSVPAMARQEQPTAPALAAKSSVPAPAPAAAAAQVPAPGQATAAAPAKANASASASAAPGAQ